MSDGPAPTERFTELADDYAAARPDYPAALFDWFAEALGVRPPASVVDVGCGTGIAATMLAQRGYRVIGIEPNDAMGAVARGLGIDCRKGTAAATGLPEGIADLVIAAQAWHWFSEDRTLTEWRRLASTTGAWAAVCWNLRTPAHPFNEAYSAVLAAHVANYGGRSYGDAAVREIKSRNLPSQRSASFPHGQTLTWRGLLSRAYSSSYVAHGVADRTRFDADLRAAFDAHRTEADTVDLGYDTVVVAWRL